jgi:hypothetical protein
MPPRTRTADAPLPALTAQQRREVRQLAMSTPLLAGEIADKLRLNPQAVTESLRRAWRVEGQTCATTS